MPHFASSLALLAHNEQLPFLSAAAALPHTQEFYSVNLSHLFS